MPDPSVAITDSIDPAVLLSVLAQVKVGDFSARVPLEWTGIAGRVADNLNDVIAANQDLEGELARISRMVGEQGRLSKRITDRGGTQWSGSVGSVNDLIEALVQPTIEMQRVIGAVADGDLSKKIRSDVHGEMLELKNTINAMVDQLNGFVSELTRVAREVGTEGKLGQAAAVSIEHGGVWKDLTDNVNLMARNLTGQVRNIAEVTTAVANGDLSKKISIDVQGEFLELKSTVNAMVDQLNGFVSELTRVAREVGVEGKLVVNAALKADLLAKKAREVQASAGQLRRLTDAAPVGIFQTDDENRYVYTNPWWSEITGIPAEDAAGRTWDDVIDSENRGELITQSVEPFALPGEVIQRFDIRTQGDSRVVLVTSVSIPDPEGGMAGWVGTVADATAEAGAEAALSRARDAANEAWRLKSDFLANMSHEIRTPMNGVIGLAELLLETELDPLQLDYAQAMRSSGEALLAIINDILDFSKVESGKLEVENNRFALRITVKNVLELLAGSAQDKGLELVVDVENSVPAVASGDSGRLRQVLTNLIGNAIKFTHAGEIVLWVSAEEVSGEDYVVRFEISDTGDGIAADKLEAIFQPFVQVDTSTSRKYDGTGLGLAISAKLVALMGGETGVSSRLGVGSTFWFTIRVHSVTRQRMDDLPVADECLAGLKALVVDDNATQRRVLSDALNDWGMTVTTAASGKEALATLRMALAAGCPFAIALVDRSMPGMNGVELTRTILGDATLAARVVLMSGRREGNGLRDSIGSDDFELLSKPIHREELSASVRSALGVNVVSPEITEPVMFTVPPRESLGGQVFGRILLAEDNLINQKVAAAMLTGAGYHVDAVLDGESAVEAVSAQSYDAVLMDCQMPGMSGYEATAAIRAREGTGKRIPIIALTAGARQEDRERCLAEGMDSYLSKPVGKEDLLAQVAHSLEKGTGTLRIVPPAIVSRAGIEGIEPDSA